MYASFGHLTGYSSNYYTYAFDKVIALDFFAQFDPCRPAGLRGRRPLPQAVLEQGGSKPDAADGARLPRPRRGVFAFSQWLNEEFEGTSCTSRFSCTAIAAAVPVAWPRII
jgi:thimet oligopeptidase